MKTERLTASFMRAPMLRGDEFLTSPRCLEGKLTVDTKGLDTPELDLKTAGE